MRERFYGAVATCAVAGLLLAALSSIAAGQALQTRNPAHSAPVPYTAEFKITQVQTLANGTTITRESTRVQALDSQGRSIFVNTSTQQYGDHAQVTSSHVDDPVSGTRTDWNSQQKKVTIVKLPPEDQRQGCWSSEAGRLTINYNTNRQRSAGNQGDSAGKIPSPPPAPAAVMRQPKPVLEDLGDATIQGVEAHGQRWTSTTPVGAIGNDQPIVHTTETWSAKGLHLVVRNLSDDPQQGKDDLELVKLDKGEPDPALFQFPDGYEVVSEDMVPCKE
jgi:hypothetical protein